MSESTTGTGAVYKDLLPIPDDTDRQDPHKIDAAQSLTEEPTASHALAQAALGHEEKGEAQLAHTGEVKDLGWNDPPSKIPAPLVGGMDNEELWILVRRFNKVTTSLLSHRQCAV